MLTRTRKEQKNRQRNLDLRYLKMKPLNYKKNDSTDTILKLNPASVLSNNKHPFVPQLMLWEHIRCLKELCDEDFELFLADSAWQDILQKLAMCRAFGSDRRKTTGKALLSTLPSLARVIKDSDYLSTRRGMLLNQKHPPPSFPTLSAVRCLHEQRTRYERKSSICPDSENLGETLFLGWSERTIQAPEPSSGVTSSQMRSLVQRQRTNSQWLTVRNQGDAYG